LYAAILEVLKISGIQADYNIGLSLGEYGALLNTEVYDFETGLKILQKRGQFMSESSIKVEGKMSAILGLETSVLEELVNASKEYVKIANYNTYGQLVISGVESAVLNINEQALKAGAKRAILLNTSGPFHTDLMVDASVKFSEYLEGINLLEPKGDILLNVSGDFYKENIKDSMVDQITSSVRFYQMVEKLIERGATTFIEIGPKKTLCSFVKKIDRKLDIYNVEDIKTLKKLLEFLKEE
jgi:[acyl-carrier-protein] S-malonyltransferase